MTRDSLNIVAVCSVLALCSGCASQTRALLADLEMQRDDVELTAVPFHRQVTDQCGPAALASVLNSSDVAVSAADLKRRVYIPDREGSLQLELLAATRSYGRIPYTVDSHPGAILAELDAGLPVLIMQNLGLKLIPRWHYAVVVGYLSDERQFVLRSADQQRLLLGSRKLLDTWRRADYWAFVALRPGQLPANADAQKYLRSVAAFESSGSGGEAIDAYRAATEQWPDNDLAWLGLGNAAYNGGNLAEAQSAYQHVLDIEPEHAIAMNNLSQVYAELGCRDDAVETLNSAMSIVHSGDPMHQHLLSTLEQVKAIESKSHCF